MVLQEENKKIRIKDIAELAGVSVGTVDRVLHERGEVSKETKKKVLEIIKKLDYKPNLFARTLALKRSVKINALLPDFKKENLYWEAPYKGILKALDELKNFNTEIQIFHFNQFNRATFIKQFNIFLRSFRISGK